MDIDSSAFHGDFSSVYEANSRNSEATKKHLTKTCVFDTLKSYDYMGIIMVITATELKANIGQYLNLLSEDDVFITKNGKIVAKLSKPNEDKQAILDSLVGITAGNPVSLEEAKKARLSRK